MFTNGVAKQIIIVLLPNIYIRSTHMTNIYYTDPWTCYMNKTEHKMPRVMLTTMCK